MRAHGAQREAARMIGVDELVVGGRHLGQHAQPAKGIDLLEGLQRALRNGPAARAMVAVAAGNEVAVEPQALTVLLEGDEGAIAVEAVTGRHSRLRNAWQGRPPRGSPSGRA